MRKVLGGAIITPAAPKAMTSCVSARMAAKPGADPPTTTGSLPMRRINLPATATPSACSSLGASPNWPSAVTPMAPQAI